GLASRPVMLVHGLADTVSPPENAHRLRAKAGAAASLWLVRDARHAETLLQGWDEYRHRSRAMFESVRQAGRAPEASGEG
ncbi:hypothetical protein LCGC14_2575520, partial [marine sediment metagenome]